MSPDKVIASKSSLHCCAWRNNLSIQYDLCRDDYCSRRLVNIDGWKPVWLLVYIPDPATSPLWNWHHILISYFGRSQLVVYLIGVTGVGWARSKNKKTIAMNHASKIQFILGNLSPFNRFFKTITIYILLCAIYRVVYLTAPPPKVSKCRPVSKFFQKKLEYPDCPPLKSLSVRLVRKIPTLRTF